MRWPRLPSRYGAAPGRIYTGDAAEAVPEAVGRTGGGRVWLATDAGVRAAGLVAPVLRALTASGARVTVYDDVQADPSEADAERARASLLEAEAGVVVAMGGGAVLDTAKAAVLLAARGGRMSDHLGSRTSEAPLLPIVAVPTTSGTGSEVQSFCLISRDDDHRKMACGDPALLPVAVVLDPRLTLSLPQEPTVLAGLDALVHALETSVTTVGTDASRAAAHDAFVRLWTHLPTVVSKPQLLGARRAVQEGATLAGMAIEASMLGAAHALANPLTATHGLPHGAAVALTAPHVVRFNLRDPVAADRYARLAASVGLPVHDLADALTVRVAALGLPTTLSGWRVRPDIASLAADAATQWTGRFNPVAVDAEQFEGLYAAMA